MNRSGKDDAVTKMKLRIAKALGKHWGHISTIDIVGLWDNFGQRYVDWGRDAALWLGRKRGRYTPPWRKRLAKRLDVPNVALV